MDSNDFLNVCNTFNELYKNKLIIQSTDFTTQSLEDIFNDNSVSGVNAMGQTINDVNYLVPAITQNLTSSISAVTSVIANIDNAITKYIQKVVSPNLGLTTTVVNTIVSELASAMSLTSFKIKTGSKLFNNFYDNYGVSLPNASIGFNVGDVYGLGENLSFSTLESGASSGEIDCVWSCVDLNPSHSVFSLVYSKDTVTEVEDYNGAGTSETISGLVADVNYYVQVKSLDSDGNILDISKINKVAAQG